MNKSYKAALIAMALVMAGPAIADNVIRVSAPIAESQLPNKWLPADPIVGSWVTTSATGCVDSPDRSALYPTTKVQYQSCNAVNRTRTVQPQEFNPRKNQYRNAGELSSETQNTSTLNQPRSLDCRYSTTGSISAWHLYGAGTTLPQYLMFAGQSLPGTLTQFQVVSAGVTYLRGASQGAKGGSSDAYQYFTVCKVLPDQP